MRWKEIEKEGNPEKAGIYLCVRKNVVFPFSLMIDYYTGDKWAGDGAVFPFTHWSEVPNSPEEEKTSFNGLCC